MDNALIGGRWSSRYAYVNAYYHAAVVLSENALHSGPQDLLFYPICYNYRHCIELHLKAMVHEADALHSALREFGEEVDDLPPKPKDMMKRHNLASLLHWFEQALAVFSNENMDPRIRKAILDLHNLDLDGQTFRYHETTDGEPTLPEQAHVDIRNLMKRMKDVHFYLHGVDIWMAERKGKVLSMLAELQPSYR